MQAVLIGTRRIYGASQSDWDWLAPICPEGVAGVPADAAWQAMLGASSASGRTQLRLRATWREEGRDLDVVFTDGDEVADQDRRYAAIDPEHYRALRAQLGKMEAYQAHGLCLEPRTWFDVTRGEALCAARAWAAPVPP